MEIIFKCPHCSTEFQVGSATAGKDAQCPECNNIIAVPPIRLGPGVLIGGFRLERHLGRGSMGDVYLATQISMGRQVAIKILPATMTVDEESVNRFLHEVKTTAKMDHPHIVTAFDAGVDEGTFFFAMSFVNGENLDQIVDREGPLPERRALSYGRDVAQALKYAWEEFKILHRDVKPENVMLDKHGTIKLMDMGISKSMQDDAGLTMPGLVFGTPHYMSPEQAWSEKPIDFRADLYAVGATIYKLVTGRPPYQGSSQQVFTMLVRPEPFPAPKSLNPELSDAANNLILTMMAANPDHRHSSWRLLIDDMERVIDGKAPLHVAPVSQAAEASPSWSTPQPEAPKAGGLRSESPSVVMPRDPTERRNRPKLQLRQDGTTGTGSHAQESEPTVLTPQETKPPTTGAQRIKLAAVAGSNTPTVNKKTPTGATNVTPTSSKKTPSGAASKTPTARSMMPSPEAAAVAAVAMTAGLELEETGADGQITVVAPNGPEPRKWYRTKLILAGVVALLCLGILACTVLLMQRPKLPPSIPGKTPASSTKPGTTPAKPETKPGPTPAKPEAKPETKPGSTPAKPEAKPGSTPAKPETKPSSPAPAPPPGKKSREPSLQERDKINAEINQKLRQAVSSYPVDTKPLIQRLGLTEPVKAASASSSQVEELIRTKKDAAIAAKVPRRDIAKEAERLKGPLKVGREVDVVPSNGPLKGKHVEGRLAQIGVQSIQIGSTFVEKAHLDAKTLSRLDEAKATKEMEAYVKSESATYDKARKDAEAAFIEAAWKQAGYLNRGGKWLSPKALLDEEVEKERKSKETQLRIPIEEEVYRKYGFTKEGTKWVKYE